MTPPVVLVLVVVLWVISLATGLISQDRGYRLAVGQFGGTDAELSECLFSIGPQASLALHPSGEPCVLAKELIGRTGQLVFIPDQPH